MALKGAGKRAISNGMSGRFDGDACLVAFTQGNVKGRRETYVTDMGRLPEAYRELMRQHFEKFGCLYVVYSYDTPIAWYPLPHPKQHLDDECEWTVPPVKYSVTTTQHQRVVVMEIHNPGFYRNMEW